MLIVLSALTAGSYYTLQWLKGESKTGQTRVENRPDYTLKNFTLTTTGEDGRVQMLLEAPWLEKSPETGVAQISHPDIRIQSRQSEVTDQREMTHWTIQSKQAMFQEDGEELILDQAVKVNRIENEERVLLMETEQLQYLPQIAMAQNDLPVHIEQSAVVIDAQGLEIDFKHNRFTLKKKVSGSRTTPEN